MLRRIHVVHDMLGFQIIIDRHLANICNSRIHHIPQQMVNYEELGQTL